MIRIIFACRECLSAEGRIILAILLILSNYFFYIRIHSFFSNSLVFIRSDWPFFWPEAALFRMRRRFAPADR